MEATTVILPRRPIWNNAKRDKPANRSQGATLALVPGDQSQLAEPSQVSCDSVNAHPDSFGQFADGDGQTRRTVKDQCQDSQRYRCQDVWVAVGMVLVTSHGKGSWGLSVL